MDKETNLKIVVICGPTASGKSDLALTVCRRFGGELIGADSMQVYRGLTIGTAALREEETRGIPQYLVGFLSPSVRFSVADYLLLAEKTIKEVAGRGRLPVICGGTGLYIQSLIEGRIYTQEKVPLELRASLQEELYNTGAQALWERLAEKDPAYAEKLHISDEKRILRGLEQYLTTGLTYAQRAEQSIPPKAPFSSLCLGLSFAERAVLYERIEARVDAMMAAGLLAEAEWVYENRRDFTTAVQAIGYKEFFPYFAGEVTLDSCVQKLKQATRNYAKRQMTWFRRMPQVNALAADAPSLRQTAEQLVREFYMNQ